MEPTLKAYIKEAKEKAGLEVSYKKTSEFAIPEEFQNRLDESPALKKAFEALTPGRQRGYSFIFLEPNNRKPGRHGLQSVCSKFSTERD